MKPIKLLTFTITRKGGVSYQFWQAVSPTGSKISINKSVAEEYKRQGVPVEKVKK